MSEELECGYSYDHDLVLIDEVDGIATLECNECGAEVVEEVGS